MLRYPQLAQSAWSPEMQERINRHFAAEKLRDAITAARETVVRRETELRVAADRLAQARRELQRLEECR